MSDRKRERAFCSRCNDWSHLDEGEKKPPIQREDIGRMLCDACISELEEVFEIGFDWCNLCHRAYEKSALIMIEGEPYCLGCKCKLPGIHSVREAMGLG